MRKFTSDWRNIALAISGVLIIGLAALLFTAEVRRLSQPVVRVGNQMLTVRDVEKEVQSRAGGAIFGQMISEELVKAYASKQGVTVSDSELDQVLESHRLEADMQDSDLEEMLTEQGLTMEDLRGQAKLTALHVKMIVPEEAIQNELKAMTGGGEPSLIVPPRYKFRQMLFPDKKSAQSAITALESDSETTIHSISASTLNGAESLKVHLYAPELTNSKRMPELEKALMGLQEGQCSEPVLVSKKPQEIYQVIQMVRAHPGIKGTMEEANILVGRSLLQKTEFKVRARELEADALKNTYIKFYPAASDYQSTVDRFNQLRMENPQIPGMEIPGEASGEGAAPAMPNVEGPAQNSAE